MIKGNSSDWIIRGVEAGVSLDFLKQNKLEVVKACEMLGLPTPKTYTLKNTSGAVIPAGSVVILKSVATGDEMTTTTVNGDNKVIGMALVATTSDRPAGVLINGHTTAKLLVSNGTSSILIGDWLSTYSHAYYAKKAVTGDTVFAMSLSSPTTSTAAINALLVNPRLI